MPVAVRRPLGTTLAAIGVVALIFAGCGGSSATAAPTTAPAGAAASGAATAAPAVTPEASVEETTQPAATEETGDSGSGDLASAAGNLASIDSYKFTMTMKGGSFGEMLGGQPMTGTVVLKPTKAAQMSFMGMDVVEVDGQSWVKLGDSWVSGDSSSSSIADSFAPEKMFGSTLSGSVADGYRAAGDEQKNGIATTHFVADASILNEYSSLFGVTGSATWSADVWIAKDGGYPVSMKVGATGGDQAFEMTFDITNINDPSNKVEKPS